nr:basic proline-rich protein-like [Penaeus vannamei]
MADVLLSLKHAVVHPHQVGDSPPPPPLMPSHHPLPPSTPAPPTPRHLPALHPHAHLHVPGAPGGPLPPARPLHHRALLPPPVGSPPSGARATPTSPRPRPWARPSPCPTPSGHLPSPSLPVHGPQRPGLARLRGGDAGEQLGGVREQYGLPGGPLPSMGPRGYSSPISSSLSGSLGGPLLPPPPSMSPFSYQQGHGKVVTRGSVAAAPSRRPCRPARARARRHARREASARRHGPAADWPKTFSQSAAWTGPGESGDLTCRATDAVISPSESDRPPPPLPSTV